MTYTGQRPLCQKWAYFHAAFVLADQSESPQRVEQGSLKHTDKPSSSHCFTLVFHCRCKSLRLSPEDFLMVGRGGACHGGTMAGCHAACAIFRKWEKKLYKYTHTYIGNCNSVAALSASAVSAEVHERPIASANFERDTLDKAKTSLFIFSFYNQKLLHTWSFSLCPNVLSY